MSSSKDAPVHPFASTATLRIYGVRESDEKKIVALFSDVRVQRTGVHPVVPNGRVKLPIVREWVANNLLCAVVESAVPHDPAAKDDQDDDRFVGFVALFNSVPKNRNAFFGIAIDPRWWGRGLGTEITKWTLNHAFEQLGLHRITLEVVAGNEVALKLYKKVGFVEEGRSRECIWQDGQWNDAIHMGILDREWAEKCKQEA